jgi:hypothetical protein
MSSPKCPDRCCDLHNLPFVVYPENIFRWVKRHGRETDQLLSSTEVRNSVAISALPRMPLWHAQLQRYFTRTFGIENINNV